MGILFGTIFLVAVVVVIPGVALIGAVYMQYLMETQPPRGARVRHPASRAPAGRAALVAVRT